MRLIAFSLIALSLTACEDVQRPTFMPSGYTYHHDVYKAPPGQPAADIGYAYTPELNEQQQVMWREIAGDLVRKLEASGVAPQPVYLEPLPFTNAFNGSFDYALREELRSRGYTLMPGAGPGALRLRYEAWREGDERAPPKKAVYNGDPAPATKPYHPEKPAQFKFTLTPYQGSQKGNEIKTQRMMPAYGYVQGEGRHPVPSRFMKGWHNAKE